MYAVKCIDGFVCYHEYPYNSSNKAEICFPTTLLSLERVHTPLDRCLKPGIYISVTSRAYYADYLELADTDFLFPFCRSAGQQHKLG